MNTLSTRNRGVALIMVIVVLLALVAIATPFTVSMQLQENEARAQMYKTQARLLAMGARNFAVGQLYRTHEVYEKSGKLDPPFNTPDWDTLQEMRVDMDLSARKDLERQVEVNLQDPQGYLWSVSVEDEQGKANLNSASPWLLGSLLGSTILVEPAGEEDGRLQVEDASVFYSDDNPTTIDGYLLLGREVISYKHVNGSTIEGCERGQLDSQAQEHKMNNLVVDYRAFKASAYPTTVIGKYAPYHSLSDLRKISAAPPHGDGLTGFAPSEIDRILPFVTVHSQRELPAGWTTPVRVERVIDDSESGGDVLVVSNGRNMSPGTQVRITRKDAVAADMADQEVHAVEYATVIWNTVTRDQGWQVFLDRHLQMTFEDGDAWEVESAKRHPINVNTAPRAVLVAMLLGLKSRNDMGYDNPETGEEVKPSLCVTREEAEAVVDAIFDYTDASGDASPIRCHEDLFELLRLCLEEQAITENSMRAILQNARNPNDYRMVVSTAPFCYKSYDTYTLEVSGIVNAPSGKQVASHRFREIVQLAPPQTAQLTLESQYDFQQKLWAPQGREVATWPNCVSMRDVYPDYSRDPDHGDVRLKSGRMFGGGVSRQSIRAGGGSAIQVTLSSGQTGYVEHFDRRPVEGFEMTPDGPRIDGQGISFPRGRTRFGPDSANRGRDSKAGSVELWFKPQWSGGGRQYLFDMAADPSLEYTNRISLFYDDEESALVFRMADGTLESTASEVRFDTADALVDDNWYHLAAAWKSTRYGEMSLLLDGRPVGRYVHRTEGGDIRVTQLSQDLDGSLGNEIFVESTVGFPPAGVILVGNEAIEYTSISPTSFVYTPYPEFDPELEQAGSAEGGTYTPQDPDTPYTPPAGGSGGSGSGGSDNTHDGSGVDLQEEDGGETSGEEEEIDLSRNVAVCRAKRGTKLTSHPSGTAVTIFGYSVELASDIPNGGATLTGEVGASTHTHTLMPWEVEDDDTSSTDPGGTDPGGTEPPTGGGGPTDGIYQPAVNNQAAVPPIVALTKDADKIEVSSTDGFPESGFLLLAKFRMQAAATQPDGGYTPPAGGSGGSGSSGSDYQTDGPSDGGDDGGGSGGGSVTTEELAIDYEMVYYGSKDDNTFKDVQRGMLNTEAREFTGRWLDVFLMSLPISGQGDYPTEGRVQVGNEWFRYDQMVDMDGQMHLVRDFGEVVEEILDTGEDNEEDLTEEPVDPDDPGSTSDDPTYTEINFKGYEFRCYNRTLKAEHASGDKVIPVFETEEPVLGRFDVVTMITQNNRQVTHRDTAMVNWADMEFVAFTDFVAQAFQQNSSRLLKFPSGETAGQLDGSVMVAAPVAGEATSGWVDEVRFATAGRGEYRLGQPLQDGDDELLLRLPSAPQMAVQIKQGQDGSPQVQVNVNTSSIPDCGVVKIGDELIGYAEKDGDFLRQLRRGLLGTTEGVHDTGDYVMNLAFMTSSAIANSLSTEEARIELQNAQSFPSSGYVLINDEMIGYTRKSGQALLVPQQNPEGPGLYRGAFGSAPGSHSAGDIAILMPFRYYDGYRENTDVPEMAYFQTSFSSHGAYWDRITWEQSVPDGIHQEVLVFARVDGKPGWDAEPTNQPGGLYRFNDPTGENIIGAQGDAVEIRVYFVYKEEAFHSNAWKSTPILRNMMVRYAQPLRVFEHEELDR